jgi:lipoyl(octanoyl) transferase
MICVRHLGSTDCSDTLRAMREFTMRRSDTTPDELWICEHGPVFTQGVGGRAEHVLSAGHIPILQTDRGGQVTYHGPGQVVAYPLVDLRRLGIFVKEFVYRLEHCAIRTLESFGITGHRVVGAAGVYVRLSDPQSHAALTGPQVDPFAGLGKIAALGIKVSRHCTYHGLALNVAMDLEPYSRIDPCGYAGLRTVDLATLGVRASWNVAAARLAENLATHLAP